MASQARRLTKAALGEAFSEGARLLWRAMARRHLSQSDLAVQMGANQSSVSRWLYGERRPTLAGVMRLHELLGIRVGAWNEPSSVAFLPPGARPETVQKAG